MTEMQIPVCQNDNTQASYAHLKNTEIELKRDKEY
jgi:hypothetical protein